MTAYKVEKPSDVIGCDDDTDIVDIPFSRIPTHKEKAVLVVIDDDYNWVPKSTVCDVDFKTKVIRIKKWIAVQKGMY